MNQNSAQGKKYESVKLGGKERLVLVESEGKECEEKILSKEEIGDAFISEPVPPLGDTGDEAAGGIAVTDEAARVIAVTDEAAGGV